ncbi:MAG: pilus assembly protein, partial [Pseudomonadota bacterium]
GTLADVARYYYEGLDVGGFDSGQVPVPDACSDDDPAPWLDCNRDLHLNTFGVTVGQQGANVWGQAMPGGGDQVYERRADAHAEPPQWWPVASSADEPGAAAQRDDLYHAVVNGYGELFSAGNAAGAASELNGALNRPSTLNAWESASTPEVVERSRREGLVYSASFNPREWLGRLTARQADLTASDSSDPQDQVLSEVIWDAGEVLDERDLQQNPRSLLTPGADGELVAFEPGNLDALPSEARRDLRAGGDRATAEQRIEYLAGERGLEGDTFRERGGRLGDIVHSNPAHVGRPAMGWPDEAPYGTAGDRYSDYLAEQRDRASTVYVGANDGMLHAFDGTPDESGGGERFAYIPSFAFDDSESRGFSYFTSPEYQHRYSVDLAPAVSDAHIETDPDAGSEWHSVLVGGMRTGGRGLFALDVTDPGVAESGSPEDLLLWEFKHPDLGTLNKPVNVTLMPWDGGHEWVAVFGNGYDAPSGRSGVFMLRLEGGLDGEWTEDEDYRFIETASDGLPGVTSDVTPVDTDGDRVPDRLYASDREGRIWVLKENDGSWSASGEPLFQTPDGQPVTTGVTVAANRFVPDDDDNAPNLLVFFGTGQYLETGDLRDTRTQSFYGVWDHGGTGLSADQLQEQGLSESVAGDVRVRSLSGDEVDWGRDQLDQKGWYFDFDTRTGERVVERPRLRNGQLRFNTTIPETAPCAAGGSSFRMFVDLDGSNPDEPNVDEDNDGELDGPNAGTEHEDGLLSGGSPAGDVLVDNSTDQEKDDETRVTRTSEPAMRRGRLGWQELVRPR